MARRKRKKNTRRRKPIRWTLAEVRRRRARGKPIPPRVQALLRQVRRAEQEIPRQIRRGLARRDAAAVRTLHAAQEEYAPDLDARDAAAYITKVITTGGKVHDQTRERRGGKQPLPQFTQSRASVSAMRKKYPDREFLPVTHTVAVTLRAAYPTITDKYVRRAARHAPSLEW